MLRDLARILDIVEQDKRLLFLLVTPRGRHFSTAFDVAITQDKDSLRMGFELSARVLLQIERLPAPALAAVGGALHGGGFELALACDLKIASESTTFRFPKPVCVLAHYMEPRDYHN